MALNASGLGTKWAGRVWGTNTGNLYVNFDKSGTASETGTNEHIGVLRLLDDRWGLALYKIHLTSSSGEIEISGDPLPDSQAEGLSKLSGKGYLNPRGEIEGDWVTELGTGGTFKLWPHDRQAEHEHEMGGRAKQFFTKKLALGPVEIKKSELIQFAQALREDFEGAEVILTIDQGTQQSTYLEQFKILKFDSAPARFAKIFVQKPETDGLNRTTTFEFGQFENFVLAQSTEESRAIGLAEKYHAKARKVERTYALNFKRLGIGVNQLLLVALLVLLPSIDNTTQRAFYAIAFLSVLLGFTSLHQRLIPNALIRLSDPDRSGIVIFGARSLSWFLGLCTMVLAGILSAKIDQIWSILASFLQ